MGTTSRIRSSEHLSWVSTQPCIVSGCWASQCDAAHVRRGTGGGMGLKPGDQWVIPLCRVHHREQHQIGEAAFERLYHLDLKNLAEATWAHSPYCTEP